MGVLLATLAASSTNHTRLRDAGIASLLPTWLDPGPGPHNVGGGETESPVAAFAAVALQLSLNEAIAPALRTDDLFDSLAGLASHAVAGPATRRRALVALVCVFGTDTEHPRAEEVRERAAVRPLQRQQFLTRLLELG